MRINVSVCRGVFQGISIHNIRKREVCVCMCFVFSLVCSLKKGIKNYNVQKGAKGLHENLTRNVFVSSNSCFHPIVVIC